MNTDSFLVSSSYRKTSLLSVKENVLLDAESFSEYEPLNVIKFFASTVSSVVVLSFAAPPYAMLLTKFTPDLPEIDVSVSDNVLCDAVPSPVALAMIIPESISTLLFAIDNWLYMASPLSVMPPRILSGLVIFTASKDTVL